MLPISKILILVFGFASQTFGQFPQYDDGFGPGGGQFNAPSPAGYGCTQEQVFHPGTTRCYKIGSPGPCGKNMKIYPESETSQVGVCECDNQKLGPCDQPLVYDPTTESCYPVYSRGPCNQGEWITWDYNRFPVCDVQTCEVSTKPMKPMNKPPKDKPGQMSKPDKMNSKDKPNKGKAGDKNKPKDQKAMEKMNKSAATPSMTMKKCGSYAFVGRRCWRINSQAFCNEGELLKWMWMGVDANGKDYFEPACQFAETQGPPEYDDYGGGQPRFGAQGGRRLGLSGFGDYDYDDGSFFQDY